MAEDDSAFSDTFASSLEKCEEEVPKLLSTQDSYEEVQDVMNRSLSLEDRERLASGNIEEIIAEVQAGDDNREDVSCDVPFQDDGNKMDPSIPPSASDISLVDQSLPETSDLSSQDIEEETDFVHTEEWRKKSKHVFIFSSAGKPIYSRHGDENKLVTMMGVMQALISVVEDKDDTLHSITAGGHKFVFLPRKYLNLVMVAESHESVEQLMLQLSYVYNQVLSVLTFSQLDRIFSKRHNYDLRRLLSGAEKFLHNLVDVMEVDPSFFLCAVRCLPLDQAIRDSIGGILAHYAKTQEIVFGLLLTGSQLICLVRKKKYTLHPVDIHLIFNLVSSSDSFKSAESWTPICLPKFDASGYLHTHVSYLDAGCHCCLLLCSVNRDVFFKLSECKQKIQEKLLRQRNLQAIVDSVTNGNYIASDLKIHGVRHFIYKQRTLCQWTGPDFEPPYTDPDNKDRLIKLYKYLHQRVHSALRPAKVVFHVGKYENLLAWVTPLFELYITFGPFVTKTVAVNAVDKLLKWLKKNGEKYFVINSPTF